MEVQVVHQREGYPILERPRVDGEDAIDDKASVRPARARWNGGGTGEGQAKSLNATDGWRGQAAALLRTSMGSRMTKTGQLRH